MNILVSEATTKYYFENMENKEDAYTQELFDKNIAGVVSNLSATEEKVVGKITKENGNIYYFAIDIDTGKVRLTLELEKNTIEPTETIYFKAYDTDGDGYTEMAIFSSVEEYTYTGLNSNGDEITVLSSDARTSKSVNFDDEISFDWTFYGTVGYNYWGFRGPRVIVFYDKMVLSSLIDFGFDRGGYPKSTFANYMRGVNNLDTRYFANFRYFFAGSLIENDDVKALNTSSATDMRRNVQ